MAGITGFIIIAGIIILLLKSKMSPLVVMTVLPVCGALFLGYRPMEVAGFMEEGIRTTVNNGILFIFSVVYFGVLADTGLFHVLVELLVKFAGNRVIAITIATTLIATIACTDGATVTAVLITIPALNPIYKRMNLDRRILLCLTGTCMSVMNLLPWSGPVARAATVLEMDLNQLWHRLIPVQLVGLAVNLILAVLLGIMAIKQGAGYLAGKEERGNRSQDEERDKAPDRELQRPRLLRFDLILTLTLVIILAAGVVPSYLAFLTALCILLAVNYPGMELQNRLIRRHAPDALLISATLYASGIMVGVFNGTGILAEMAAILVRVIPASMGQYIHVIFGLLALPIGMSVGTDAYFYGIMPLAIRLGESYGVPAVSTACAMLIGRCLTPMVCPLTPAVYLGLSMAETELKEHLKFSIPVYWIASIVFLGAGMVLGIM